MNAYHVWSGTSSESYFFSMRFIDIERTCYKKRLHFARPTKILRNLRIVGKKRVQAEVENLRMFWLVESDLL